MLQQSPSFCESSRPLRRGKNGTPIEQLTRLVSAHRGSACCRPCHSDSTRSCSMRPVESRSGSARANSSFWVFGPMGNLTRSSVNDHRRRRTRSEGNSDQRLFDLGTRPTVIPFVDLQAQYRSIETEVNEAVLGVFASTQFVLGSEVAAFESAVRRPCLGRSCAGCQLGHERTASRHARCGARTRRRSHHHADDVHRHGVRNRLHGRNAGLRRHRSGHTQHRSGTHRSEDHLRGPRRSFPSTSTACRPTSTRSSRSLSATGSS